MSHILDASVFGGKTINLSATASDFGLANTQSGAAPADAVAAAATGVEQVWSFLQLHIFNIAGAIIVLCVGLLLIKLLMKLSRRWIKKSKIPASAHKFLLSIIRILLLFVLLIIVGGLLGINTGSLIAILGAAGLAISLALRDSLSNLAGGILVIVSRPFKIGDYIQLGDDCGYVAEIGLVYTRLNTIDNRRIFFPNSQIATSKLINHFAEENRMVDILISISYEEDIEKAKAVILEVIRSNRLALDSPPPLVRVSNHSSSSIDITTRAWTKSENYWTLGYDLFEQIKLAFDENRITIPFPQVDAHIYNS